MKHLMVIGVLVGSALSVFAQTTLRGQVTDDTSAPVAYVSIGIPGTAAGTVSDENGRFLLEIPEKAADSVQFYHLGFEKKTLPRTVWEPADREVRVALTPAVIALREVEIRPDQGRTVLLGKEKMKARMSVNFAIEGKIQQNLGSEIGRRFKVEQAATLEQFLFYVSENDFDTVRFRINVYDLRRGEPDRLILKQQPLAILTDRAKGWVTVDLRPLDLRVEEWIAVSVEWIYGSKGGGVLALPIGMPVAGSKHYYKFGSRNRWKSYAGMSAAMVLQVRY